MVVSERTKEQVHLDIYNQNRGYFLSFLKHTDQKANTVARIHTRLKVDYLGIVEAFEACSPDGRVLDIGSGGGHDYFPLLHKFPRNNVRTTFHEPNLGMAILFFVKYLASGFRFENLEIHRQPKTDAFVCTEKDKYVLGLGTHCFYYIDDWESSARAFYDTIRPGGVGCITMTSRKGDLYKFRERYFPAVGLKDPRSAEDLEELLEKMGIDFVSEEFESSLVVDDEEEEKNVLSFILRKHYDQLGEVPKAMIESYLISQGMKDKGNLKLKLKDKIIWIPKSGEFTFKPGERKPRWDLEDITIGRFKEFFQWHIDSLLDPAFEYINKKRSRKPTVVDDEIRRGYEYLLIGDVFVSDPFFTQIAMIDENRLGAPVKFIGPDGKEYWGSPTASQMKLLSERMEIGLGEGAYEAWNDRQFARQSGFGMEWIDDYFDMVCMEINRAEKARVDPWTFRCLMADFYRAFKHHKIFTVDGFSLFNEIVKQNPHMSMQAKVKEDVNRLLRFLSKPENAERMKKMMLELNESEDVGIPKEFIEKVLSDLSAKAGQNNPHNPA